MGGKKAVAGDDWKQLLLSPKNLCIFFIFKIKGIRKYILDRFNCLIVLLESKKKRHMCFCAREGLEKPTVGSKFSLC